MRYRENRGFEIVFFTPILIGLFFSIKDKIQTPKQTYHTISYSTDSIITTDTSFSVKINADTIITPKDSILQNIIPKKEIYNLKIDIVKDNINNSNNDTIKQLTDSIKIDILKKTDSIKEEVIFKDTIIQKIKNEIENKDSILIEKKQKRFLFFKIK